MHGFFFQGDAHEVIARFRRQVEQMVGAAMQIKQSWFHSSISRDLAEKRMRSRALIDGLFLVRQRETSGSYSMCLAHRGQLYHYLLDVDSEQLLSIQDGRKFDTLLSVSATHIENYVLLIGKVKSPCCLPVILTHTVAVRYSLVINSCMCFFYLLIKKCLCWSRGIRFFL